MATQASVYRYSEIFYSAQGEGKYTGIPSAWLRFFMCNLQCNGFGQKDPTDESSYELPYKEVIQQMKDNPDKYKQLEELPVFDKGCDSSYSWHAGFKKLQRSGTPEEIAQRLCDIIPTGKFSNRYQDTHLCITGGEPLMPHSQKAVVEILQVLRNMEGGTNGSKYPNGTNTPRHLTFETNGTQPLSQGFIDYFYNEGASGFGDPYGSELFWSISPKLWNVSGEKPEKAIKPNVLKTYRMLSKHGQLKFVMTPKQEAWDELELVIEEFRDNGIDYPIWIMPVGATVEGQQVTAGEVANIALSKGYNISARMHCYLWGNLIGV